MKTLFFTVICSPFLMIATHGFSEKQPDKPPELPRLVCDAFKECGKRLELYGDYLYLQPNGSDLYYGVEANGLNPDIAVPALSPNWKVLEINPDYHSGFEVGLGILGATAGLNINWERLHTKDKESFTAPAADGFMVGPLFDIGPNSASYKVAQGKALFYFDEGNLNLAKEFCPFKNWRTKISGGGSFARIKQTVQSNYSNNDNTISRRVRTSSTFIGGGPQLGIGYDYQISKGLHLVGNSVFSLYMGRLKTRRRFNRQRLN